MKDFESKHNLSCKEILVYLPRTRAYNICKNRESTDKNCAAYCLGYRSSGTGE